MQQLVTLRQGLMILEDFHDEFIRLLKKVDHDDNWSEDLKTKWYLDKVDPRLVTHIFLAEPDSLAAAMEAAEKANTGMTWKIIIERKPSKQT